MRTRAEIVSDMVASAKVPGESPDLRDSLLRLLIEVNLDIRDLLSRSGVPTK